MPTKTAWPSLPQARDNAVQSILWAGEGRPGGPLVNAVRPERCPGEAVRRHQAPHENTAAVLQAAAGALRRQSAEVETFESLLKARGATLHAFELRRAQRDVVSENSAVGNVASLEKPTTPSTRAATPARKLTTPSTRAATPAPASTREASPAADWAPASSREASPAADWSQRNASPVSARGSTVDHSEYSFGGALNSMQMQMASTLGGNFLRGSQSRPNSARDGAASHFAQRHLAEQRAAQASQARKSRIQELQQGINDHDEEMLARVALGTAPLLGRRGEPVLPVPPLEMRDSRLPLQTRLRVLSSNKSAKEAVRNLLLSSQVLGEEAKDRALESHAQDLLEGGVVQSEPRHFDTEHFSAQRWDRFDHGALQERSLEELFQEVARLESSCQGGSGACEEQWIRLASQFCSRAYETNLRDILRMVRIVSASARGKRGLSARGKKELLRAADHLLQSLTGRLQDCGAGFLTEVVETMGSAACGTQVFLDMLMTLLMGLHRRDRKAPTASEALRLANALGLAASPDCGLRLRPKGTGGPTAAINRRVMEVLQERVAAHASEFSAEELASIHEYYLTRLMDERGQKAILTRMGEMELGLREDTKQCLPLVLDLSESIHREIPEPVRWSLSRTVRQYLEKLKTLRLERNMPWTCGLPAPSPGIAPARQLDDPVSPSRSGLQKRQGRPEVGRPATS